MSSPIARLLRASSRRFCSAAAATDASAVPNAKPSPRKYVKTLDATIDSLFKERDLDRLVSRFKEASASHRFRCRHRIYEIAVRRLAAAGRQDGVAEILEAQKRYPEEISHEGFAVRVISLYGRAGLVADAAETFRQLPSLGCRRTVMSFNALLTACFEAGDYGRMDELFRSVPEESPEITPDAVSYNVVIGAMCERGDLDAAICMLEAMESGGLSPDLITFNTLLNGYYNNGKFSDAEKLWAKMAERNLDPDIKSFNAKLRGLVSEGRTSDAVELLDQLPSKGLKPDSFSFNALIKGYCQAGNLEDAKKVFENLTKNDCRPNRRTFETLVPRLCEAGELDLALSMCKESMSRKCFVEAEVLQKVVDGLAGESRVEDAKKLVELCRLNYYSKKSLRVPLPSSTK